MLFSKPFCVFLFLISIASDSVSGQVYEIPGSKDCHAMNDSFISSLQNIITLSKVKNLFSSNQCKLRLVKDGYDSTKLDSSYKFTNSTDTVILNIEYGIQIPVYISVHSILISALFPKCEPSMSLSKFNSSMHLDFRCRIIYITAPSGAVKFSFIRKKLDRIVYGYVDLN